MKETFVKLLVTNIRFISKKVKIVSTNLRKKCCFFFFVKMHLTCKNADLQILKCSVCLLFLIAVSSSHFQFTNSHKNPFSYFIGTNILCIRLEI